MKRENLSRLLSLMLVLVLSVSLLAGCSSEEVPYSASAEEYDDVYVTLVSIEPMVKVGTGENYTETACVCYTTSGDEVGVVAAGGGVGAEVQDFMALLAQMLGDQILHGDRTVVAGD